MNYGELIVHDALELGICPGQTEVNLKYKKKKTNKQNKTVSKSEIRACPNNHMEFGKKLGDFVSTSRTLSSVTMK